MNGARMLHFKSSLVEEAVNELINTLLDVDAPPEDSPEDVHRENASPHGDASGERRGRHFCFQDIC